MKKSIFRKIVILIVLLLIPILALYSYSYLTSVNVVRKSVDELNWSRLSFFMSQLELYTDELSKSAVLVGRDPSVAEYIRDRDRTTRFEAFKKRSDVEKKLSLQIAVSGWVNQQTLYFPDFQEVISTDYSIPYDDIDKLSEQKAKVWTYRYDPNGSFFSKYYPSDTLGTNFLVEARLMELNLRNMLNRFNSVGQGGAFFYHRDQEPIVQDTANMVNVNVLLDFLRSEALEENGSEIVELGGRKYVINYMHSDSLEGWHLVNYFPLQEVVRPITESRNLFNTSIGLLLALSMLAAFLLYRNVQIPIRQLVNGVKKIGKGQYSTRLSARPDNDFHYLFVSFNQMAEDIQRLIETGYENKIRLREATLKQLQSQINPHFLYNCLFYIKNTAALGDKEAVVAMALNLGEYFRHTTRVSRPLTTVEEEIAMIRNYLVIQNLRIERFHYEIDIPDEMLALEIPRLIVQPVVENGLIHGIGRISGFGMLTLVGECTEEEYRIVVEDNGPGMTQEEMEKLQRQVGLSMDEDIGCGLWNVNQRLIHLYKSGSGIRFGRSDLGGLRVDIVWKRGTTEEEREESNV
ncbi:sensor histidine kinase [Cohnella hongkongensis]|uniref:Sensor histidine kinase n=1 Tax=Cohnella hongkongensis TaxID=178337 RepID=A0ABV9F949_9BACL